MRVELGDVKKRQLTEERLKHLQAALEDNAKKIAGVQQAAVRGGKEGAAQLTHSLDRTAYQMHQKVDDAVRALSEVRREASDSILARKRNVRLFMLFSALTGLATGALLTLVVFDHYLGRNYMDRLQGFNGQFWCRSDGGLVVSQSDGNFCAMPMTQ